MSALGKYKRKVSEMLPCIGEEKKYCLKEIDHSLGSAASSMSYEAIVEALGSPESLAASAIQDMDASAIAAAMKTRNRLFWRLSILVAGFLLIWAIGVTLAYIHFLQEGEGHDYIIGPIEIESEWIP